MKYVYGTALVLLLSISSGSLDKAGENKYYQFIDRLKIVMKSFEVRNIRLALCIFRSALAKRFHDDPQISAFMTTEAQEFILTRLKRLMRASEQDIRQALMCMERNFFVRIGGVVAGMNYTQCLEDTYKKVIATFQKSERNAKAFRPPIEDVVNKVASSVKYRLPLVNPSSAKKSAFKRLDNLMERALLQKRDFLVAGCEDCEKEVDQVSQTNVTAPVTSASQAKEAARPSNSAPKKRHATIEVYSH